MDLERKEQQLTRWIDGELDGDELREFEKAVAADPSLRAAKEEAESLRQEMRAASHDPASEIPNPDFFSHQVQQRIAAESAPDSTPVGTPGGILSWFRSPFTLASAAVVALGLFALSMINGGDNGATPEHTSVASTYTPDKSIEASHFYSDEADATVIVLDGLAALPDSTELNGQNIVSSEPGSPNQLYNEESELAYVIFQGEDSLPILRAVN